MKSIYATKRVLQNQTPETANINTLAEITAQLSMQFDIEGAKESDTLDELGLRGTASGKLAGILSIRFPFLTENAALDAIHGSKTLEDLTLKILAKAGVECQQSLLEN
jgi:hypothetical protein